jgi:uncharacterized phage-associated protein
MFHTCYAMMHFTIQQTNLAPYSPYVLKESMSLPVSINSYDERTALAAVLHVAQKLPIIHKGWKPDLHRVYKILYFADKNHLQKYGSSILFESYKAHNWGPVPRQIEAMVRSNNSDYGFVVNRSNPKVPLVIPQVQPDYDYLSESEIEALDAAILQYGNKPFLELTDLSHDAAYDMGRTRSDYQMLLDEIIDTLPNAAEVKAFISDSDL